MGSVTLRPNAAGSNTNQIKSGAGGDNYDRVADDSDLTYCSNGTDTSNYKLDTYNIATPTIPDGATIDSVAVKVRWAGNASRGGYIKPALYIGSTAYDGTEQFREDATIVEYTKTWTVNPADSAAWEASDLVDLQAGDAVKSASGSGSKCYEVWVTINYTEAAGGAVIPVFMNQYRQRRR